MDVPLTSMTFPARDTSKRPPDQTSAPSVLETDSHALRPGPGFVGEDSQWVFQLQCSQESNAHFAAHEAGPPGRISAEIEQQHFGIRVALDLDCGLIFGSRTVTLAHLFAIQRNDAAGDLNPYAVAALHDVHDLLEGR